MNKNNFDGVRIGLALIVVFAHISNLTLLPDFRIFQDIFDSNFAVKGFFCISGFLVTLSYQGSKTLPEYFGKRLHRIYPAYFVAVLLCIFIGVFTTALNSLEFIKSPETLKYIISNLVFLNFIQPTLPKVFLTNPFHTLNGALWTIKIELMLYICVPILVYCFKKFGAIKAVTSIYILSLFWVYYFLHVYSGSMGEELARQFPGQLSYFVLGSFCAFNEKSRVCIKPIALMSVPILFTSNNLIFKLLLDPIAYCSIVLYLSTGAYRDLNLGRFGDISYGIYLYHFPIIQLLIYCRLYEFNPWVGLLCTLIITIALAMLSWHYIEKIFLKRTSHYVQATKK